MGSEEAKKLIENTLASSKFMIAAFRLEGKELCLDRLSSDFPYEQFKEAVRLLRANLEEELRENGMSMEGNQPLQNIHPKSSLNAKRSSKEKDDE